MISLINSMTHKIPLLQYKIDFGRHFEFRALVLVAQDFKIFHMVISTAMISGILCSKFTLFAKYLCCTSSIITKPKRGQYVENAVVFVTSGYAYSFSYVDLGVSFEKLFLSTIVFENNAG